MTRLDRASYDFDPANPLHVSCIDDPFDIRPILTATLDEISRIIDEELKPNQQLVIIAGENHKMASHKMLWQALIYRLFDGALADPDPNSIMMVAHELPHNESVTGVSEALRMVATAATAWAPYTSHHLFNALRKKPIPLIFNDLASMKEGDQNIIDQKDGYSKEIITKHAPKLLGQSIRRSGDANGMALRNYAMVELALKRAREINAQIIFQICGRSHVFGNVKKGYLFEDSLSYLYKEASQPDRPKPYILPLITDDTFSRVEDLPENSKPLLPKSVISRDLLGHKFTNKDKKPIYEELACARYIFYRSGREESGLVRPKGFLSQTFQSWVPYSVHRIKSKIQRLAVQYAPFIN